MSQKIAVVVPTIRPESWELFYEAWKHLFEKHSVRVFKVDDSFETPMVSFSGNGIRLGQFQPFGFVKEKWVFNKTDACRNAGFFAAHHSDCDIIISLDDDVYPVGDPIQDHINALSMSVSPTWISTAQDWRVRGIPVGGEEWPVMLSHGVWNGVPDFDAPTQLLNPNVENIAFNRTNVPEGVLFPMCIMNVAFRRELLPWMYQAPMGQRLSEFSLPIGDRFADIWSGVVAKLVCDQKQWGVVTGYSTILHSRASNVFANLRKESVFLEANETFAQEWQNPDTTDDYILLYRRMLSAWQKNLENE